VRNQFTKFKGKELCANKYTSQIAANDELLVISSGDKCSGKISSNYIRWCFCATSPSHGVSNKFLFLISDNEKDQKT